MVDNLARVSANAVVPDQLVPYVAAVSGLESSLAGGCLLHRGGGEAVLVAYPARNPLDSAAVEAAVDEALRLPGIENLAVLAAARPRQAPAWAKSSVDAYWRIPLPAAKPGMKLRNMLRRAAREVEITAASGAGAWSAEHAALSGVFCRTRTGLDGGTRLLFGKLGDYLAGAPDAVLFSARSKANGELAAFAIGDFTAISTCFYMFACRRKNAPPGTADLLLASLIGEGEARGHARINLGLGINPGIEFFKKKWGAEKFLPLVETSWRVKRRCGFLSRLLGG